MVCGKDWANPEIIRLKNIPIESTMAAFWNVVLIPAPTPRRLGGRLFMMLAPELLTWGAVLRCV
jgi:hypothetical protein